MRTQMHKCIQCGKRRQRGMSLFCGIACRTRFETVMAEAVACFGCDASATGVVDALQQGWRDIVADPEGRDWNYRGFCPDCVREDE